MKKTITLVALLTSVVVFSCSVFGATSSPASAVTTDYSNSNILVQISAVTLLPDWDDEYNYSANGGFVTLDVTHMVTVRITNTSSQSRYISLTSFNINFGNSTTGMAGTQYYQIYDVENFGPDFNCSYLNSTSYFYCIAPAEWSYLNNICVPANSSISSVFTFKTMGYKYPNISASYAVVDNVAVIGTPTVTPTDFIPNGSNNDVLNSINSLITYLNGNGGIPYINNSLDAINTVLGNIHTDLSVTIHGDMATIHSDLGTIHSDLSTTNNWLQDIWGRIKNIQDILTGDSTTNSNISTDSGSLKTQSDNIHTQEQAYYTANSQAIQATGLSNYQFNNEIASGVAQVTDQFNGIWNSLGTWTNVYIFSLTLGLALTIIRHSPNAISRKIRNNYSE